mmetsp:Transcript_117747/g.205019  ORF Transcript_117747/g.205019 Transcript_117747/m.205019 type:complete len:91 (-) Transcript_117747:8-280(-)
MLGFCCLFFSVSFLVPSAPSGYLMLALTTLLNMTDTHSCPWPPLTPAVPITRLLGDTIPPQIAALSLHNDKGPGFQQKSDSFQTWSGGNH